MQRIQWIHPFAQGKKVQLNFNLHLTGLLSKKTKEVAKEWARPCKISVSPDRVNTALFYFFLQYKQLLLTLIKYLLSQWLFYCSEETPWPRQLLYKKASKFLKKRFTCCFRSLVYYHRGREHGSTHEATAGVWKLHPGLKLRGVVEVDRLGLP